MQKMSMQKLSILGLVLLAASAVTAAIVPSKKDKDSSKFAAGTLTNNTVGGASSITCGPDTNSHQTNGACNVSTGAGSLTTEGQENTSNNDPSSSQPNPDGGAGGNQTTSADVIS